MLEREQPGASQPKNESAQRVPPTSALLLTAAATAAAAAGLFSRRCRAALPAVVRAPATTTVAVVADAADKLRPFRAVPRR